MMQLQDALSLPQSLGRIQRALDLIADRLEKLRSDEPVRRPEGRVILVMLSSAGNQQARTPSVELHITGLFIGGDTAGRATLQIGQWLIPFFIPVNQSQFYGLSEDDQIIIKNDRISYNPPTGTTNWDVVLLGHPRA